MRLQSLAGKSALAVQVWMRMGASAPCIRLGVVGRDRALDDVAVTRRQDAADDGQTVLGPPHVPLRLYMTIHTERSMKQAGGNVSRCGLSWADRKLLRTHLVETASDLARLPVICRDAHPPQHRAQHSRARFSAQPDGRAWAAPWPRPAFSPTDAPPSAAPAEPRD